MWQVLQQTTLQQAASMCTPPSQDLLVGLCPTPPPIDLHSLTRKNIKSAIADCQSGVQRGPGRFGRVRNSKQLLNGTHECTELQELQLAHGQQNLTWM